MADLTVAELNPLVHGLERMTDETTPTGADLARQVDVDWTNGRILLPHDAVKQAASESLPEPVAAALLSATADVVNGGVAVFKDVLTTEASTIMDGEQTPSEDSVLYAVPWVVISDLVHASQGAPPPLRSALGIDGVTTEDELAERLRDSFPTVPKWLLAGEAAGLYLRDPVAAGPLAGWGAGVIPVDAPPPRPGGDQGPWPASGGMTPVSMSDAITVAQCLVKGKWNGLGGHWWGWPFGWQVGLSQPCANTMAQVLLGTNGGGKLFNAIVEVVKARGVSTGLKTLTLTAGTAISLYAAALGVNILAVNGSKGIRLQGNWPVIGGPGAFVWAIKG